MKIIGKQSGMGTNPHNGEKLFISAEEFLELMGIEYDGKYDILGMRVNINNSKVEVTWGEPPFWPLLVEGVYHDSNWMEDGLEINLRLVTNEYGAPQDAGRNPLTKYLLAENMIHGINVDSFKSHSPGWVRQAIMDRKEVWLVRQVDQTDIKDVLIGSWEECITDLENYGVSRYEIMLTKPEPFFKGE